MFNNCLLLNIDHHEYKHTHTHLNNIEFDSTVKDLIGFFSYKKKNIMLANESDKQNNTHKLTYTHTIILLIVLFEFLVNKGAIVNSELNQLKTMQYFFFF